MNLLLTLALTATASALDLPGLGLPMQGSTAMFNRSALPLDEWWGPEELRLHQNTSIRPARIEFSDQLIADLRDRLQRHVPFKPPLKGAAFTYGFNSDAIEDWLSYWAKEYPFKQQEAFLNHFPQYKTNIQGLDIQFIWIRAPKSGKDIAPILLLHGWPGSIREFYEVIPMLAVDRPDKDFVLDIVLPCLPGFGFSDPAVRPGMGAVQVAVIMRNLMLRLGYERFYVQGGDFGAITNSYMTTLFPQEVLGHHTNWALSVSPVALGLTLFGALNPSIIVEPRYADRIYPLSEKLSNLLEESGYLHEQATKPDTIGIALTDSPAGLLAYILEKFSTGTLPANMELPDGGLHNTFTREQLIDDVMFYWAPSSITTSIRLYAETLNKNHIGLGLAPISTPVPTWVIQAKYEITYQPPKILRLKYPNLLNTTVLDFGGHFFALQHPDIMSESILTAIEAFRNWHRFNRIEGGVLSNQPARSVPIE